MDFPIVPSATTMWTLRLSAHWFDLSSHILLPDHHSLQGGFLTACLTWFISFWSLLWHKPSSQAFMPNGGTLLTARQKGDHSPSSASKFHWLAGSLRDSHWCWDPLPGLRSVVVLPSPSRDRKVLSDRGAQPRTPKGQMVTYSTMGSCLPLPTAPHLRHLKKCDWCIWKVTQLGSIMRVLHSLSKQKPYGLYKVWTSVFWNSPMIERMSCQIALQNLNRGMKSVH